MYHPQPTTPMKSYLRSKMVCSSASKPLENTPIGLPYITIKIEHALHFLDTPLRTKHLIIFQNVISQNL